MIKKILFIILLLLSINSSYAYFCCRDIETNQQRCYSSGNCCNNYWYQNCNDFEVWVTSTKFWIGKQTPVNIYVRNTGAYTFSYQIIDYRVFGNSQLVLIDLPDSDIKLAPSTTGYLQPKILLLSQIRGDPIQVSFWISNGYAIKRVDMFVTSDEMLNLNEFSFVLLFVLMFSSAFLIYRKI
ncbi:MAG: hypothetical protein QXM68_03245 [Candidatus Aenigmatarchaeota archaeon]|nr:hypothetical protein [Candidatus Aenigmarchaeota archaeon]